MKKTPTPAQRAFGQRLRQRREEKDLTLDDIAKAAGKISPQAVEQWESGVTSPKQHRLVAVARLLEVDLGWLLTGVDVDGSRQNGIASAPNNTGRTVPRIRWDDVTDKNSAIEGTAQNTVLSSFPCGPLSFALIITDRSNSPEYEPGDIIIIDPDLDAIPGDMVLATLHASSAPIFRKFREIGRSDDGSTIVELAPLNDDWTSDQIVLGRTGRVVGVRSEHSRPRRS